MTCMQCNEYKLCTLFTEIYNYFSILSHTFKRVCISLRHLYVAVAM